MHPRLFELGPVTGLHLRRPAGRRLSARTAARDRSSEKRAASTRTASSISASTSSSARWSARSCCCSSPTSARSPPNPRELLTLARSGGVFYGGLILAVVVALWYIRHRPAAVDHLRRVRAGHCARPRRRPLRLFVRGLLLRQADDHAVGHHVHRSVCRRQRGHAAECAAASDAALRSRRGAADPGSCCSTERKGRRLPGRTFWLYMLLYAVSRFIIEFFRGDERGMVGMFSTSQFISILLAPLAIVMLVYLSRGADAGAEARAEGGVRAAERPIRLRFNDRCRHRSSRRARRQSRASPGPIPRSVLPDQSRSHIQRLIKEGPVQVAGRRRKPISRSRRADVASTFRSRSNPRRSRKRCHCRFSTRTAT